MTYVEHDEERLFVLRKIKIKIKNSLNLKYLPSRLDESKICKKNIWYNEIYVKKYINLVYDVKLMKMVLTLMMRMMMMMKGMYRLPIDIKIHLQ